LKPLLLPLRQGLVLLLSVLLLVEACAELRLRLLSFESGTAHPCACKGNTNGAQKPKFCCLNLT
jgi:hypothetical protein